MFKCYDYEYDLYEQPFFSLPMDKERSVVIKIKECANIRKLSGFSVKLNKYGNPGNIEYLIQQKLNTCGISSGTIDESLVMPVFEDFVHVTFDPVEIHGDFFITLKTSSGKLPLDGYRVFGPRQDNGEIFDEAEVPPYWWDTKYSFGMAVPSYYKPGKHPESDFSYTIDENGNEKSSVSVCLYSEAESKDDMHCFGQFSHLKKLFAPKYSEWHRIPEKLSGENEVCLNNDWSIEWDEKLPDTKLVMNIKEELGEFLKRCFNITPQGNKSKLLFMIDKTLNVNGTEGHVIEVSQNRIEIIAKTPSGLMRALHFIEDIMLEKRCPALEKGKYVRDSLYELRMTSGMYPAPYNYFPLQTGEIWNEGYLWRLVRSGFNAIWGVVNLEELIENSNILPGFGTPTAAYALERLKRMTEAAEAYGVDFYIDLKTGYFGRFDPNMYETHPELKTFEKWGNYPCTGVHTFEKLLDEVITNLFEVVPRLKGLMLIYDSEGFYSCFNHNKQLNCPNCKDKTPNELAYNLFSNLLSNVRKSRSDAQIIAWTYYCDEQWNYDLIKNLPDGIVMLSCFSQFVSFTRYGVTNRTDDYACCVTGPGEYFEKVYGVSSKKGMPIIAKTELSQGQEFVSVPYIPTLTQHQKRWDKLKEYELSGFMGDYIHCNFKPSPCTDLMRLNLFETQKDGGLWQDSKEKLQFTARLNYGKDASDAVLKAWEIFSEALCEEFPYSPGVCRYPGPLQAGPTQPFYLDPERPLKRVSARCNCPDLRWTEIYFIDMEGYGKNPDWNAELVKRCFKEFINKFDKGIALLNEIIDKSDRKADLEELVDIASIMNCMSRSMVHFIDFVWLRDESKSIKQRDAYMKMLEVCELEMENSKRARELCGKRPQLGFSGEGQGTVRGGLFNAYTIDEKIKELDFTMESIKEMLKAEC